ncbi:hypothetical protein MNV49_005563 [Pseudohyphozyma bogoriensis]|nr:hypothetical protein MNV49_005563 [Pseudohyphozyma bogoriensis]
MQPSNSLGYQASTNLYEQPGMQSSIHPGIQHHTPQPTPTRCDGPWQHQEYRGQSLLRDKYDQILEQLSAANARIAALASSPSAPSPLPRANLAGPSTSNGIRTPHGSSTPHLPPPAPDASAFAAYRLQTQEYTRPVFASSQLLHVNNYSKELAAQTAMQTHIPDLQGHLPTDVEWKQICKDRKQVCGALLDISTTWTAQDDAALDLCCDWLEMKHPRLQICDDSRWKAMNVLKARFEEARKPITAGTKGKKRELADEFQIGDDVLNLPDEKKIRQLEDIAVDM